MLETGTILEGEPVESEEEKIRKLKEIMKIKLSEGDGIMNLEKIADFSDKLGESYPGVNFGQYKLHHILSSSSFDDERSPFLDLPGGEIERFIREEL